MEMEALRFSETSGHLSTTQCSNPKSAIWEGRNGHSTPGVSYREQKTRGCAVTQRAGCLARERPLDFGPHSCSCTAVLSPLVTGERQAAI